MFKAILLIILILTIFFSACSSDRAAQSETTGQASSSAPAVEGIIDTKTTPQSPVNSETAAPSPVDEEAADFSPAAEIEKSTDFEKLKTSVNLKLQIAEEDGQFFSAAPELSNKLLSILKGYFEIPYDSPHGQETGKLELHSYRYILRFEGFSDIYVLDDSNFLIEGKNDYFYENNNFSYLLDTMKYMQLQDEGTDKIYAGAKGLLQEFLYNCSEETFKSLQRDINGDGRKETLELYFDGEFVIWIDGVRYGFDADSGLYYVNMQTRGGNLTPMLSLIPDKGSGSDLICVSFSHVGADNWHEEVYTMRYTKECKFELIKIGDTGKIKSVYENDMIKLSFPDWNIETQIKFTEKEYWEQSQYNPADNEKPEDYLTGEDLLTLYQPQGYKFVDVNSDGEKELIIGTFLKRDFHFYICNAEIVYSLKDGCWTPVQIKEIKDYDGLTADEAAALMIQFLGTAIAGNLSFDGQGETTGLFMYSWSNPGRGTGASWYVSPFSGDVYDYKNDYIGNLMEKKAKAD